MTPKEKDDMAATALRNVVDLLQLLKYNVEWFKGLEFHKHIPTDKNLRPDCAKLMNALNAFLFALKEKTGDNITGLLQIMKRDHLHDLSMLLEETYTIDNVADITAAIKQMKVDGAGEFANNTPAAL